MVAAYVAAGFARSISTPDGLPRRTAALDDAIIAGRAARLARAAEDARDAERNQPPFYIIGTEVPVPGGAIR